jgi:DNA-binding transcriptional ArsR family regulator
MATNAGMAAVRVTKESAARAKAAERRLRAASGTADQMKFLCDPMRLSAVLMLAKGEFHVGAIAAALKMSQPAISHHLALLRHGKVVAQRRQGRNVFYGLTDAGRRLAEAARSLAI